MEKAMKTVVDIMKNGLRKGQQVEFKYQGKLCKGVVERGGKRRVTVVIFGEPNKAVKGSPICFTPTEFDIPEDPSPDPMAGYEVRKHRIIPKLCDDTIAYHAEVWKDGKRILDASNNGSGGPDSFYPTQKGKTYAVVKQFEDNADAWARECGLKNPFESGGMWIDWYINHRPYGETARDYMQEFAGKYN